VAVRRRKLLDCKGDREAWEDAVKTIGVDLWGDQCRGFAGNHATMVGRATRPPLAPAGLRELFVGAYARFAAECRAVDEPGVAVVAIDERTGRPAGVVRVRARVGRYVAAIIGRHDRCDLFLDGSDELALRHLAVVVDPVASFSRGADAPYRILDLRTRDGFRDERGRQLRGMRCEGPAIVRCAGYVIFSLPLGDPTNWPANGADAWAYLPERVYFEELEHVPEHSRSQIPRLPRATDHRSHITITHGPRDSGEILVGRDDLVGMLEIEGPSGRGVLNVGADALRDGVLLGRYARCDGASTDDPSMSRVHALLVRFDDDVLLVVDVASTNGTARAGEEHARVIEVDRDTELQLGKGTRARWRWVS
jgi:hypothetical protein